MLIYRLVNNLNVAEDSAWQELVLKSLGPDIHPNRQKSFCLAREALRSCLNSLGINLSIPQLELINYRKIKDIPHLTLSISHTNEWGAAVVADEKEFTAVGIDIEPSNRVVKDLILERISHKDDAKLSPINIWALKEAAFKALMNTGRFDKNEEFSSILISEKGWEHPSSNTQGEWKIEHQDSMILAIAWIRN